MPNLTRPPTRIAPRRLGKASRALTCRRLARAVVEDQISLRARGAIDAVMVANGVLVGVLMLARGVPLAGAVALLITGVLIILAWRDLAGRRRSWRAEQAKMRTALAADGHPVGQ